MEKIIKYDSFLNEETFILTDSIPVETLRHFCKFLSENQSFLFNEKQYVKIFKIEKVDEKGTYFNIGFTVYKDKTCSTVIGPSEHKFKIKY